MDYQVRIFGGIGRRWVDQAKIFGRVDRTDYRFVLAIAVNALRFNWFKDRVDGRLCRKCLSRKRTGFLLKWRFLLQSLQIGSVEAGFWRLRLEDDLHLLLNLLVLGLDFILGCFPVWVHLHLEGWCKDTRRQLTVTHVVCFQYLLLVGHLFGVLSYNAIFCRIIC